MAILLVVAFLSRFYAAASVPLIEDEKERYAIAQEISFSPQNPHLPIGSKVTNHPLLVAYVLKLGMVIFGDSKLASRLIFVLLSVISLYVIYKLVKENLGSKKAILVLALLTFSQYHIGSSRLIDENTLLLFFVSLVIYFFFKFIKTGKQKWVLLTFLAAGLGYLSKELIIFLIPAFVIYIITNKKHQSLLKAKTKEIILSSLIALLLVSPHLLWSVQNNFYNFTYKQQHKMGVSLRSFYLYLAELPIVISNYKPEIFIWPPSSYRVLENRERILREKVPQAISFSSEKGLRLRMDGVYEYPVESLLIGIAIIISALLILIRKGKQGDLIKFSFILFSVSFITPCLFDPSSLFAYHYWASMSIFPGMIIFAHLLGDLSNRHRLLGNMCIGVFAIYSIARASVFISLPENYYLAPRTELYGLCLERAERYVKDGTISEAKRICKWLQSQDIGQTNELELQRILEKVEP
ncbi:MAG: glycosyltransferase family 39 protein [Candidatus Omnitrophica bacterium]|nr:glycosyltransferase family 39 protein [Candidatus Omnitrophota bacterium]